MVEKLKKVYLRKTLGWTVLLFIALSPVILLFSLGPKVDLTTYENFTHFLGQICSLVGFTLFAITFVLSTRLKFIEEIFGGLDKSYVVHAVVGGSALILLLFHPIMLSLKFIPSNVAAAVSLLLPHLSTWSVNFGLMALLGLVLLIFLTLFAKMKYHHWKWTHKFLGLIFFFAVLHVFLVRSDASRDYIFHGYYIYVGIVSAVGLTAYIYSLLFKSIKSLPYTVASIKMMNDNVVELIFSPVKKALKYKSGQFVFLSFKDNIVGGEQHPFSICSRANEPKIRVMIKDVGDFTSRLKELKVGDKLKIEGPYGRFGFYAADDQQIWLAGGIGITPFVGMAKDLPAGRKVHLFFSARTAKDLVALNEFQKLQEENADFKIIPWISQTKGHLTFANIKKIIGNVHGKSYFLCGPEAFKLSLKNAIMDAGVDASKIFDEDFTFK